jgi:hypothetical protein
MTAVNRRVEALRVVGRVMLQDYSIQDAGTFGQAVRMLTAMVGAGLPNLLRCRKDMRSEALEMGVKTLAERVRIGCPIVVSFVFDLRISVPPRTTMALKDAKGLLSLLEAVQPDGTTRLMESVGSPLAIMTVPLLLQTGIEVNATRADGTTALMRACTYGHMATVQALLDAKAHIDAMNSAGKTALSLASKAAIVSLLTERGAKKSAAGAAE